MSLLPRVRLELARRPWLYWLFAGTCAVLAWSGVAGAQSAAERAHQQWGTARTVYVATRAVGPGDALVVQRRQYPAAMVPATAVHELPADALAAHPLVAGEIIVQADVAGASAAPAHWPVFAVDATGAPALVAGDPVGVFADGARSCDGVVAAVTPDIVEVAVPPACAPGVSAQVAVGGVVLARGQPTD